MKWVIVCAGVALAGAAMSDGPRAASRGDVWTQDLIGQGWTLVPLERLATGHLTVEVRLNAQRGLFLIDTGASQTVLDANRAQMYPLGPVVTRTTVTGMVGAQQVEGRRVQVYRIGAVSGTQALIYVADLSFVTEAIAALGGPVVDGIVGQDWLTAHGAVIDMAGERMFLRP